MSPAVWRYTPVMTLKHVVLPAPLGPMRPKIWLRSISKLTRSRATRPPKRIVRSVRRRTGSAVLGAFPAILELGGPAAVGDDALGAEDHHHDEGGAEHEHPVLGKGAEALGQVRDHDGADDGAGEVPRPSQHDGGEEQDRE